MFGLGTGQNQFLAQFMKQRSAIAAKATAMPATATKATSKGGVPSIGGLPTKEMNLATICESKPKPKVVREYFAKRVEELVSEM
jgi:hypothetical protein